MGPIGKIHAVALLSNNLLRVSAGFGLLNTELGAKSNVKAKINPLLEVIPIIFY